MVCLGWGQWEDMARSHWGLETCDCANIQLTRLVLHRPVVVCADCFLYLAHRTREVEPSASSFVTLGVTWSRAGESFIDDYWLWSLAQIVFSDKCVTIYRMHVFCCLPFGESVFFHPHIYSFTFMKILWVNYICFKTFLCLQRWNMSILCSCLWVCLYSSWHVKIWVS